MKLCSNDDIFRKQKLKSSFSARKEKKNEIEKNRLHKAKELMHTNNQSDFLEELFSEISILFSVLS